MYDETYSEKERVGVRSGFAHNVAYRLTIGNFKPNKTEKTSRYKARIRSIFRQLSLASADKDNYRSVDKVSK